MAKAKQKLSKGFIKELSKPKTLEAGVAPFTWSAPVVKPQANDMGTSYKLARGQAVAKPKSSMDMELKKHIDNRRAKK